MILSMIESLISTPNGYNPHVLEDMKKHLTRWIRLGECIHPSEYTKAFPTTASAFGVLRNTPKKIKTWASRVDSARQEFNFDKMMEGKSAVYISHRLSSTRFCDKIAMFMDGRIVEYGTHEELLAQKGEYASMFEVQAQYYENDGKEGTVHEEA